MLTQNPRPTCEDCSTPGDPGVWNDVPVWQCPSCGSVLEQTIRL